MSVHVKHGNCGGIELALNLLIPVSILWTLRFIDSRFGLFLSRVADGGEKKATKFYRSPTSKIVDC